MVCPAPQPQPQPAAADANWLDRLRSSRGFPPADDLDLGSFLASQTADDLPKPRAVSPSRGHRRSETVADILNDLFVMGGGGGDCERFRGKSLRKQRNPKFWSGTGCSNSKKSSINGGCSSDDLRRGKNNVDGLASSGDNSLNQRRKEQDRKSADELRVEVEVEEDEDVDLRGYSKSEVTVIDSSVQGWKSEMCVFRKGKNEWKVREKKGKSRNSTDVRKKRKSAKPISSDRDEDDNADEKRRKKDKKNMLRVSDPPPCSSSRNGKGDQRAEGQLNHDKVDRDALLLANDEAPIKSLPCSNSHWKLNSGTSSVILVRPFSASDKVGTRKPGKISTDRDQNLP